MNLLKKIKPEDLDLLKIIGIVANNLNLKCYLVGGYVRDLVIGNNNVSKDLDFVVINPQKQTFQLGIIFAENLVKELSAIGTTSDVVYQKNFGTCQFKYNNTDIEIVGARKESYDRNSRKPIVEDGSLMDDQLRRDFKMNDIYISLNPKSFGKLIDPFNGVGDIKNKIISTPRNPDIIFSDDPLRMLRAIRFASVLNFEISNETKNAIVKNADRIKIVSNERIITELNKILKSNKSYIGFQLLSDLGLLKIILPEVYNLKGREAINGILHKDNLYHTLQVLKNWDLTNDDDIKNLNGDLLWIKWAALLHDTGKILAKKFDFEQHKWTFYSHEIYSLKIVDNVFKRLRLPLDKQFEYVKFIISEHERIKISSKESTDSAIRRLIVLLGDNLWDLFLFGINDTSSSKPNIRVKRNTTYRVLYNRSLEIMERDNLVNFKLSVDGNELMKVFNLSPSKIVGILKAEMKEAIIEGRVENTYDACLKYIKEYYDNHVN